MIISSLRARITEGHPHIWFIYFISTYFLIFCCRNSKLDPRCCSESLLGCSMLSKYALYCYYKLETHSKTTKGPKIKAHKPELFQTLPDSLSVTHQLGRHAPASDTLSHHFQCRKGLFSFIQLASLPLQSPFSFWGEWWSHKALNSLRTQG